MNTLPLVSPAFDHVPALDQRTRNIVIARAMAGAYDASETLAKAIVVCRAAARQNLGMGRLNPRQADAVDALVHATRARAFEAQNPIVHGATLVPETVAMPVSSARASTTDSEMLQLILAGVRRIEAVIWAVGTVVVRYIASLRGGKPAPGGELPAWAGPAASELASSSACAELDAYVPPPLPSLRRLAASYATAYGKDEPS
jgi:hypothetical protein